MKIPSLRPGSFSKPSGSLNKQEVVAAFGASSRGLKASPWSWKEGVPQAFAESPNLELTEGEVMGECLRNSWGGYWGTHEKTKKRRAQS